jgi:hypothetical protein
MAGLFLMVREDGADDLVDQLNQIRASHNESLSLVDVKFRNLVLALPRSAWKGVVIPSNPDIPIPKRSRQLLKRLWRQIEASATVTAEDRTILHGCEFARYFTAPLQLSPIAFGRQLLREMGRTWPQWLSDAWDRATALFEGTPFETRMRNARRQNGFKFYANFEPVHQFMMPLLEGFSEYRYVFGYEPPSLHAAFCGYASGKIDLSMFYGAPEVIDGDSQSRLAVREAAEESGLPEDDLALALDEADRLGLGGPFQCDHRTCFIALMPS